MSILLWPRKMISILQWKIFSVFLRQLRCYQLFHHRRWYSRSCHHRFKYVNNFVVTTENDYDFAITVEDVLYRGTGTQYHHDRRKCSQFCWNGRSSQFHCDHVTQCVQFCRERDRSTLMKILPRLQKMIRILPDHGRSSNCCNSRPKF